jgi:hypothetical protein
MLLTTCLRCSGLPEVPWWLVPWWLVPWWLTLQYLRGTQTL